MNTLPVHREACFTFTPFPFVPKVSIFVFVPCIYYFYVFDEKETQGRRVSTLVALWPFKSHVALWPAHLSCGLGCFSLWEVQLQGVGFGSGWRQANGNYRFLKKKRAVSAAGSFLASSAYGLCIGQWPHVGDSVRKDSWIRLAVAQEWQTLEYFLC